MGQERVTEGGICNLQISHSRERAGEGQPEGKDGRSFGENIRSMEDES